MREGRGNGRIVCQRNVDDQRKAHAKNKGKKEEPREWPDLILSRNKVIHA